MCFAPSYLAYIFLLVKYNRCRKAQFFFILNPSDILYLANKFIDMKTDELIKEIKRLPVSKRILVIEKTLQSIRVEDDQNAMLYAAETLSSDYKADGELTIFTNIDFDNFYETK